MRSRPVVPVIDGSPIEECSVRPLKSDGRLRFPACFVEIIVQNDDAASRFRGVLHLDNRPFRLADPLNGTGSSYNIELAIEPVANRQNIRTLKAEVLDCAIFLNCDCQVGVVAIDTPRYSAGTDCLSDTSSDRPRAATYVEDMH